MGLFDFGIATASSSFQSEGQDISERMSFNIGVRTVASLPEVSVIILPGRSIDVYDLGFFYCARSFWTLSTVSTGTVRSYVVGAWDRGGSSCVILEK